MVVGRHLVAILAVASLVVMWLGHGALRTSKARDGGASVREAGGRGAHAYFRSTTAEGTTTRRRPAVPLDALIHHEASLLTPQHRLGGIPTVNSESRVRPPQPHHEEQQPKPNVAALHVTARTDQQLEPPARPKRPARLWGTYARDVPVGVATTGTDGVSRGFYTDRRPEKTRFVPWLPGAVARGQGNLTDGAFVRSGTYAVAVSPADTDATAPERVTWNVVSSDHPRALTWDGLVTPAEADAIIDVATSSLARSSVGSGKDTAVEKSRSSHGMFLATPEQREHWANVALRRRILAATGLRAPEWLEATQVLRYEPGQQYLPHHDYYPERLEKELRRGGQRIVTVLTCLRDVEGGGGATAFPLGVNRTAEAADAAAGIDVASQLYRGDRKIRGSPPWVADKYVLRVQPKLGRGIMFYSAYERSAAPNATATATRNAADAAAASSSFVRPSSGPNSVFGMDPHSLHAGEPPTTGTKWVAVVWCHPRAFT